MTVLMYFSLTWIYFSLVYAENDQSIFDAVLQGHLDFSSDPWPSISSSSKDLVKKMLRSDPRERIFAAEVLMREDGDTSDKPLDIVVLSRMKQFRAMNKLEKLALKVIAENFFKEEIIGLKEMFKYIDIDNSGTITFEELKAGLTKMGTKISESEVRQLMKAVFPWLFLILWLLFPLFLAHISILKLFFMFILQIWQALDHLLSF
ncbi:Calcium-dependent protein kinase 3 [Capsicum annuum]|uniref:Calcium-dependent protein kinase 3 n=1 Tax=Capsicum annuum TaxID=4072 RepID=A0A2G3ALG1_CAPAN|nr:Calcium-dependent protein kinase 3 [Capsicum annuum]KAF3616711.1 Calcium-dependent protein kinase 3 [Capsicum annuum]PHT95069.1 Calcium-dependent protein kinase 3 [Capsicum annuum]